MTKQSSNNETIGAGPFTYEKDPDWTPIPLAWATPDISAVAIDKNDNVYLLNPDEDILRVYTSHGTFINELNLTNLCSDQSRHDVEPVAPQGRKATYRHSVTVGPDDTFYCTDIRENTVRQFSLGGKLLRTLGTPGIGSETGTTTDFRFVAYGGEPFNGPTKLAVARSGDLYVSDGYRNARVHCFTPEGELKFSWGAPGKGSAEFNLPHSIAITPSDEIVVADRENNRLVFFDLDGNYLDQWTDILRPADIAIDEDGLIYVVEMGLYATSWSFLPPDGVTEPPSRCTVYSQRGEILARWGSRDSSIPGALYAPHCVAVDSYGDIYIGEINKGFRPASLGFGPWHFETLHKFARMPIEGSR